jgi:hypothetical protein
VEVGLNRLLEGLDRGWDDVKIAEHIASGLREKWRKHG